MPGRSDRNGPLQQRINLLLALRGTQDVQLLAHHPDTAEASVSLRIGGALLYFRDWPSAVAMARGWEQLSREAMLLPARLRQPDSARRRVDNIRAVTAIDVVGVVQVRGELQRIPGFETRLLITMGRLEMLLGDRQAYTSVRTALRDTEVLCASVLPMPAKPDLRAIAMERALGALQPPQSSGLRRPDSPAQPPLQPQTVRRAQATEGWRG
jgi:hypothetical protein